METGRGRRKEKKMPPGVRRLPKGITWHTPKGYSPGYLIRISYGGKQISVGRHETLEEAKAALRDITKRINEGRFIPPAELRRRAILEQEERDRQRLTVAEYADVWLEDLRDHVDKPRSPATLTTYRSTLNAHILPAFGDVWMIDVTQSAVDNLLRKTERTAGPGARRNVASVLRAMYRHAVENKAGGMIKAPFKVVTRKPEKRDDEEIPTPLQVTQISAHLPQELALAPVLAAVCALRAGETLGLQRGDVQGLQTDNPVLKVRRQWNTKTSPPSYTDPKGGASRTVTIPRFLVPQIQAHLDKFVGPLEDAPLFPSPRVPGKPLSGNAYRNQWNKAVEAAGMPPFVLHSLRHLGLTLIALAGATQQEILDRGGHTDLEVAARYQHTLDGRAVELAAALGNQWEAGNE